MAWQLVAIWAIIAITTFAFLRGELRLRRRAGRPLRRVSGNELHLPRERRAAAKAGATAGAKPVTDAARLRRARLRSIGF